MKANGNRAVLLGACLLIVLGGLFWGLGDLRSRGRGADIDVVKMRERLPAINLGVPPTPLALRPDDGRRVRLNFNVASASIQASDEDLGRGEMRYNRDGIVGKAERLLGTPAYPTPPFPPREGYARLKDAVIDRLNEAGYRAVGDMEDIVPEAEALPTVHIQRTLVKGDDGAAFLQIRVFLEQRLFRDPRLGGVVWAEPNYPRASYVGARRNADVWKWTESAVLYTVDRFVQQSRVPRPRRGAGSDGAGESGDRRRGGIKRMVAP